MGNGGVSGLLSKSENTSFDSSPLNVSLIRGIFFCLIRSKIEVHELCVLISFANPVAN